jgi:hypothetical protein
VSLKKRLAEYGFESNDSFDFALQCLYQAPLAGVRMLNVCGRSARRKTAFANALGHALDFAHLLYHDFGDSSRAQPKSNAVTADEPTIVELPTAPFDRVMVEACAFSEAERTVVILDQLHQAEFRDHIRLYHFASDREWPSPQGSVVANQKHLLVVLISDEPLYLSLQKVSFRIWCEPLPGSFDFRPEEFGLGRDASELFGTLRTLFSALEAQPTHSELDKLLNDLLNRVGSEEQLRQALFGRVESVERERLYAPSITPYLRGVIEALMSWRGSEEIQLNS